MEFDFTKVDEAKDLPLVPPGVYLLKVKQVRARKTLEGDEMWRLQLVVEEGPYEGRTAAWDNLVWSPRSIGRVKRVLRLMGFPVEGRLRIEPEDLVGKVVRARVVQDTYKDPTDGRPLVRNRVPFGGYLENDAGEEADREDLPF